MKNYLFVIVSGYLCLSIGYGQNKIVRYEYWLDNDLSTKTSVPISPVLEYSLDESISLQSLSEGIHTISVRFQVEQGLYSSVSRHTFYKGKSDELVLEYRYWFDNDFGQAQEEILPNPQSVYSLTPFINVGDLSPGIHDFHIQFKDAEGKWTGVITQSFDNDKSANSVGTVKFWNRISNNPVFNIDKELWPGSSDPTILRPIKICADGSKATIVEFENLSGTPNEFIKFTTLNYENDPNREEYGVFDPSPTDVTISGNVIKWTFTHPSYINSPNSIYGIDIFQIIDTRDNSILYRQTLQIYRSPIVFMHGLWGDAGTFEEVAKYFVDNNLYPPSRSYVDGPLLFRAAYPNNRRLKRNKNALPIAINSLISQVREENYSASSVDVIAHSMGGLVSRVYIQEAYGVVYGKDINKFITINTPHSGSQLANRLAVVQAPLVPGCSIMNWIQGEEGTNGIPTCTEAVFDLRVNSNAIDNILNDPNSQPHVVPSFTITSVDNNCSDPNSFCNFIKKVVNPLNPISNNCSGFQILFDDEHDIVVAKESQQGGLDPLYTENFEDICHIGPYNNPFIKEKLVELLHLPPTRQYFSLDGFSPADLKKSNFNEARQSFGLAPKNSDSVKITSPLNGMQFNSGETITIQISSSQNVQKVIFAAGNEEIQPFAYDTLHHSTSIRYQIPDEAFGEVRFIAVGVDSTRTIGLDTIRINVNTTALLDSFVVYPNNIFMPENEVVFARVTGFFSDGIRRDLSYEPQIQYHISDTTVAAHEAPNEIRALSQDTTILTVRYDSIQRTVPITVYQGDSTLTSNELFEANSESHTLMVDNFPNPFSEITRIDLELDRPSSINLNVYTLQGKMMVSKSFGYLAGTRQSIEFDGSHLPPGIYPFKLLSSENVYAGRFVIVR